MSETDNDSTLSPADRHIDKAVWSATKAPVKITGGILSILGFRRLFSGKFAWLLLIALLLIILFGADPLGLRSAVRGESISDQKSQQIEQIAKWTEEGKSARVQANQIHDLDALRREITGEAMQIYDAPFEVIHRPNLPRSATSITPTGGLLDEVTDTGDWKKNLGASTP